MTTDTERVIMMGKSKRLIMEYDGSMYRVCGWSRWVAPRFKTWQEAVDFMDYAWSEINAYA